MRHPLTHRPNALSLGMLVLLPGYAASQISPDGHCAIEGLVMAGVFSDGLGLNAGLTGSLAYLTPAVADWPFQLDCVEGALRLKSGRVNGATELTSEAAWMHEEARTFSVAFRGTDISPLGKLILFAVRPGLLPSDTPVVTYSSMDGNNVMLLKGVLAVASPGYEAYVPPWR